MSNQYEIDVDYDFNQAKTYAQTYIVPVLVQINMRGLMITTALQKFVKFTGLPESSSMLSSLWDAAFAVVTMAVPVLRLTALLKESEAAVALASALGDRRAQAISVVRKAGKVGETVNGAKDTYDKLGKAIPEQPEGMTELAKLDASKGPIHELLADANRAVANWGKAMNAIDKEKWIRLSDQTKKPTESMLSMIQKMLPKVTPLTSDDLDQIEELYLWQMISTYVRSNVYIEDTQRQGYSEISSAIKGLNDTQQDTIVGLFGFGAKRGHYFYKPPMMNIWVALLTWNVQRKQVFIERQWTGHMQ